MTLPAPATRPPKGSKGQNEKENQNSKEKKKKLSESLFVRGEEELGFFCLFVWEGGGALEILKGERLFCFALLYRYITGKVLFRDEVELLMTAKWLSVTAYIPRGNEHSSIFILHKNRRALPPAASSPTGAGTQHRDPPSAHPAPARPAPSPARGLGGIKLKPTRGCSRQR